jgi:hypothetical protein
MDLFGFGMLNNYEQRKVARDELEDTIIDTVLVTDSLQPYETAISHAKYNNGDWIVVEMYDTKEEANLGHDRWVKIMTNDNLPDELVDVSSCEIAQLWEGIGGEKPSYKRID